ncbi:MAG: RraA family protein [Solirubrobacterales bacterium]|nr:RraA family protein [Solirubrobacterales bacterium]MBV9714830.1 RraA family protein [Solirubrobacterales bacterium]
MEELLESLARYDAPTLANAIETLDVQPRDVGFADSRIRCMFPELGRMVGFAATATIVARGKPGPDWAGAGNDALYAHVRTVRPPRVVVVQDLDDPPAHGSLWGEVHATIFGALGCVGCVTDGAVRDLDEARGMGFHFFAAGPSVSHAYVRVETVGEPVEIGGLVVAPGDLLHADQHGVLKIPLDIAAALPAAAERVIETEQALLRWVRSDDFNPARLPEMRARH